MYDLGIIGGMGPEATKYLYNLIINLTEVEKDQDHLSMIILNNSKIPDRSKYILHNMENPLPYIVESINDLLKLNVKKIVMTCNTAHYFQKDIKELLGDKFISLVDETNEYIIKNYKEKDVYLLATTGTVVGQVYQSNQINYKNPHNQEKIMDIIYEIKQNKIEKKLLADKLNKHLEECDKDNSIFLLGCTELSLLKEYLNIEIIDPLEIVAKKIVKELK